MICELLLQKKILIFLPRILILRNSKILVSNYSFLEEEMSISDIFHIYISRYEIYMYLYVYI